MCGRARLSSDVSEIKLVFSIPPHRPMPLDEPREGARVFLSGESPFLALFDLAAILVPARER